MHEDMHILAFQGAVSHKKELFCLLFDASMATKIKLKGIVRPFELGSETRLIRSIVINWSFYLILNETILWRPGKVFLKVLMIKSHG